MDYRVTIRGTDIELRGQVSGDATLRMVANAMDGLAMVIASPLGMEPEADA